MSERKFKEVQTQRGKVVVLSSEDSPNTLEGIFVGSGRNIGEDEDLKTIEIFNPEESELFLIPLTAVIERKFDQIEPHSYVMIEYKGKVKGKKNSYHDFKVMVAEAEAEELTALAEYIETIS